MKHVSLHDLLAILKVRGYRITKARTTLIEYLLNRKTPFTMREIVEKCPHLDEVTVYRTFETLKKEGLMSEVLGFNETHYEISHAHHHHAICTECGYTSHVPCKQPRLSKDLPPEFHRITRHEVVLYGLCAQCS